MYPLSKYVTILNAKNEDKFDYNLALQSRGQKPYFQKS